MKRLFKIFAMLVVGFALAAPVGAAEFGTADEAVALAKKAIAYVKEVGVDKAAKHSADGDEGLENGTEAAGAGNGEPEESGADESATDQPENGSLD